MKKLLLLLLLTLPLISMASNTTPIIGGDAEQLIDKYSSKIAENFSNMMESAVPAVKEGFTMVVRLQIAQGIAYLLIPIFTMFFWWFFYKNYKIAKADDDYDWVAGKNGLLGVIFLILSCIGTISSIPGLYHGILHVAAPEWCAVKEIITLVR